MNDSQLADDNLIESFRMHARWQQNCELVERDGLLMLTGEIPRPGLYTNSAVRLDPELPASDALERANDFFARRERSFMLLTRSRIDQDLEQKLAEWGIESPMGAPCMTISRRLDPPSLPEGVHLAAVDSADVLRDSVRVNVDAYPRLGLPGEVVAALFEQADRVLEDNVCGYVAYRDGEPLATALTYVTGPAAGIYWVGTVAAAERQGLAGACTRMAVNAGLDRGAKLVTLQASPFGLPVYQRLGFETYGDEKFFPMDPK